MVDHNMSLASASSLVRNQLRRPKATPAEMEVSVLDDMSVDVSIQGGAANASMRSHDVMASFGGFLEKRKKDKHMQRDSMMSEIDGLVTDLHSDINKMMESSKRIKNQTIIENTS